MKTKTFLPLLALFGLAVSCQTSAFTYQNDIYTKSTDGQYRTQRTQDTQNQQQSAQSQQERTNLYNDD